MRASFFRCTALLPGAWIEVDVAGRPGIRLCCPACGLPIEVEKHRVLRTGSIDQLVECIQQCPFQSLARLEDWKKKEVFKMKKYAYALLLLALLGLPSIASAGMLDLGKAAQWLWDTSKERGTLGASIDLNGDKTIAGAIKLNKKGWGPAYALAGVEVLAQNEQDAIAQLSDNTRWRVFASPAVDVFWFWRKIRGNNKLEPLDLLKLPDDWELLAGPTLRIPTTALTHFTWRGNTAFFIALRAKVGKAPGASGNNGS